EVMREDLAVLLEPCAIELLDGGANGLVECLSMGGEEAIIGHILGEGVFEEIAALWEEAPVVDQPQRLQMLKTVGALVFPLGDFLEELQRELPPDDGGRLDKPLLPLGESVDPGRDHVLDRIWDLPLEGALREDVAILVLLQGTHLQEGLGQL